MNNLMDSIPAENYEIGTYVAADFNDPVFLGVIKEDEKSNHYVEYLEELEGENDGDWKVEAKDYGWKEEIPFMFYTPDDSEELYDYDEEDYSQNDDEESYGEHCYDF